MSIVNRWAADLLAVNLFPKSYCTHAVEQMQVCGRCRQDGENLRDTGQQSGAFLCVPMQQNPAAPDGSSLRHFAITPGNTGRHPLSALRNSTSRQPFAATSSKTAQYRRPLFAAPGGIDAQPGYPFREHRASI
jgi:hypothetical protein